MTDVSVEYSRPSARERKIFGGRELASKATGELGAEYTRLSDSLIASLK